MQETITHEQLQALKMAFEYNDWYCHFLNITVVLPIPAITLHRIILSGRKRRFKQRRRYAKSVYFLRKIVNTLFLTGLLIIFFLSIFAMFSFVVSSIYSLTSSPHPTSIPWINNKSDCERTHRKWDQGYCWDEEHNPMF